MSRIMSRISQDVCFYAFYATLYLRLEPLGQKKIKDRRTRKDERVPSLFRVWLSTKKYLKQKLLTIANNSTAIFL